MSDELRIGTSERESASQALNAHLEAGRLGVEEYADRSALAANATTAADLAALFSDLPAPHPTLPGEPGTAVEPRREPQAPARRFSGAGARIAAASPIVALILFFVLNSAGVGMAWLAFLLIPLVGALGFSRDRAEEREDRARRRELRDR